MFGMKGNALILIFIKGRCDNLLLLINLCSNLGQCDISDSMGKVQVYSQFLLIARYAYLY